MTGSSTTSATRYTCLSIIDVHFSCWVFFNSLFTLSCSLQTQMKSKMTMPWRRDIIASRSLGVALPWPVFTFFTIPFETDILVEQRKARRMHLDWHIELKTRELVVLFLLHLSAQVVEKKRVRGKRVSKISSKWQQKDRRKLEELNSIPVAEPRVREMFVDTHCQQTHGRDYLYLLIITSPLFVQQKRKRKRIRKGRRFFRNIRPTSI